MAFDTSVTAIDAILKDDYQGPVREQLNSATVFLKRVAKNTKDFHGRRVIIPLHKGRNIGVGAASENGALPAAGNQQYDKSVWDVRQLYGTIQLTGLAMESAKSNVGSFIKGLDSEMKGLAKDLKVDQNRQLWHDGSGLLTNATAATSATITVDSTKFLAVGTLVQPAVLADGSSPGTARSVASITSSTVVVLSGSTAVPAAGGLFKTGSRDLSDTTTAKIRYEVFGLEALVSASNAGNGLGTAAGEDGLIGQITRTGNAWWQANSLLNGGTVRPLTLDLMQNAFDLSEIEGDSVPGLILTNHAMKRRYAGLLVADKRYPAGGDITLDGGYSALEFNGTPLVADKDGTLTNTPSVLRRMYFLSMSSFEQQILKDWSWLDADGSILKMLPSTVTSGIGTYKDSWVAYMGSYQELACTRPNSNCVLGDIDEAA